MSKTSPYPYTCMVPTACLSSIMVRPELYRRNVFYGILSNICPVKDENVLNSGSFVFYRFALMNSHPVPLCC
jgi:hypothetical protein